MTKSFCDRCEAEITEADRQPFIREDTKSNIRIALIVTNLNDHAIVDVCNRCKAEIVSNSDSSSLPVVAISTPQTPKQIFQTEAPPVTFEPSMPPQPKKISRNRRQTASRPAEE